MLPTIHCQLSLDDKPYTPSLKGLIGGRCKATVNYDPIVTAMDAAFRAQKNGMTSVVTTSEKLLRGITKDDNASLSDYAGSLINYMGVDHLFIDPLKQLRTLPYGKHLTQRFLSKLLLPKNWIDFPVFEWTLYNPSMYQEWYSLLSTCDFIAVDTENDYPSPNRCIECCCFTAVTLGPVLSIRTVVVPVEDEYAITVIGNFLNLPTPKVMQNGKFDISYFMRFGIPPTNYLLDTIQFFHAWYSELPKDLGLISLYCIRKWQYHKDEGKSQDHMVRYRYNAMDGYSTACAAITLLTEMPEFAIRNYEMKFPMVYPCIVNELTGIKIDIEAKNNLAIRLAGIIEEKKAYLRILVDDKNYNPKSPQQTVKLWKALGCEDITSSDDIHMDKVKHRHPLNYLIVTAIKDYREPFDLNAKYVAKDFIWHGRCFYVVNPHGTNTGRESSKESHFNCGLQIQNIPVDDDAEEAPINVKDMFIADDGFYLGEADYNQNETWCTAYLSGDPTLIKTVEDKSKYFHAVNAMNFFGLEYDTLAKSTQLPNGEWSHKKLNKSIILISKRVNHGANYNMTAPVLLDTMKIENVLNAKRLLNLDSSLSPIQVCQYLLDRFDITFDTLRSTYYGTIKSEVNSTGMLVGPTGWTRICFSDPLNSKRALNMYVAHKSQSLAAMILDQAYISVYKNVYLPNMNDFKLHAPVHDSIIFSYRQGREDLARLVPKYMNIKTGITDINGVEHILNVPTELKGNAIRWSQLEIII